MKNPLMKWRISNRVLCLLVVALLLVSLVPLYALSFFNHACYDDFGFSIRTHEAVRAGGGFLGAVKAAFENTVTIRNTWEGTYTSSFISALQPAIFGEGNYWLTTAILLTFFLFSLWCFLRESLRFRLGASATAYWLVFACAAFVMIQFVPDLSEAFFWFNGGVAYTLMWSLMLVRLSVWLRMERAASKAGQVIWSVLLVIFSVLVGGSKYSTVLFALLVDVLLLVYAFHGKRPLRLVQLLCTLVMAGLMVFSALAPGNAVRAATLSGGMSPVMAIAQAMFFGISLLGHWFSLPLVAVWGIAIWQLSGALKNSRLSFRYPLLITAVGICLFCAQLTPTLVTGNYLGDGRSVNTYYFGYVLLFTGLVLYWAGWLLRKQENGDLSWLRCPDSESLRVTAALALAVLLAVGCICYHPDGSLSYGPQNMSSGSALRSLASGEAAAYDEAMDHRDQEMNDPTITDAVLRPVTTIPAAFMGDAPVDEMGDYVQTLYAEYYLKDSVTIEKGE